MPIDYAIDRAAGVVYTTAWDTVTDGDVLGHKERLATDANFDPDFVELSDVTKVNELAVTPAGIAAFADADREQGGRAGPSRLALVASADVVFGMARMYEQRTDPAHERVRVFRDLEEARSWLGLPPASGAAG